MIALTDICEMPFGKHKGTKMEAVPASYLLWLHAEGCKHPGVAGYIKESLSALEKECPDIIVKKP